MNILLFLVLAYLNSSVVVSLTPAELNFELAKADANHHNSPGKSYRHRNRRSEEEELRKTFGISSGGKRRRAPVKNLISQEEIRAFFDDWLPRRSTVPPSTAVTKSQRLVKVFPKSTRMNKKKQKQKLDRHKDEGKKFSPWISIKPKKKYADKEDPAVKALIMLLKSEARQLRKKILKRKINETKKDIQKLEFLKTVKSMKTPASESIEFAEWLGRSIEDQEAEMQKRKRGDSDSLKPIALQSARSSGRTFFAKRRRNGSTNQQRRVFSAPVVFEPTPAPLTNAFPVNNGQLRTWRKTVPTSAPTIRASVSGVTTRSAVFGALTVDGEFKRQMETLANPKMMNEIIDRQDRVPYPFSHCYVTNKDGLMCCNRFLESLIRKSYYKTKRMARSANINDLQELALKIQKDSERVFNTTFETIVSYEDYTLRAHFAGDLMCKVHQGGKFITVYATAMPYRDGSKADPLSTITPISLNAISLHSEIEDLVITRPHPRRTIQLIPYHELSREDIENERILPDDFRN